MVLFPVYSLCKKGYIIHKMEEGVTHCNQESQRLSNLPILIQFMETVILNGMYHSHSTCSD